MRAKADELTEQYAKTNEQTKQEKAEKRAIQDAQLKEMQAELEKAREAVKKSIDFQDTPLGTKEDKDKLIEGIKTFN
jgi:DNA-binding protein H-NS